MIATILIWVICVLALLDQIARAPRLDGGDVIEMSGLDEVKAIGSSGPPDGAATGWAAKQKSFSAVIRKQL